MWDAALASVAGLVGFTSAHAVYVLAMLLAYPAALAFHALPNDRPALKHALAASAGFGLGWLCFGAYMLETLAVVLPAYAAVLLYGWHRMTPLLVLAAAMMHLAYCHIETMAVGPATLHTTGLQMVLVIKVSSFAWNVYDGARLARQGEEDVKMAPELRMRALPNVPSLPEYLGFIYFFGSLLAGPAHDLLEYRRAFGAASARAGEVDAPRTNVRPALERLGTALLCAPGVFLSSTYPLVFARSPAFRIGTTFLYRFAYVQLASCLQRFQYYFVWKITEGSCILAGMGYTGRRRPDGTDDWSGVENVDIVGLETAPNFKTLTDSWNKSVNQWLRFYVYWRVRDLVAKDGDRQASRGDEARYTLRATIATYVVSALWHGFYLGYYLTFLSGALLTIVHRAVRHRVRPWVLDYASRSSLPVKRAYNVLGWLTTMISINYVAASFVLLNARDCFALYKSLGFSVHILAAVLFFLVERVVPRLVPRTAPPLPATAAAAPAGQIDSEPPSAGPSTDTVSEFAVDTADRGEGKGGDEPSSARRHPFEVHRRPLYSTRVRDPMGE